MQALVRVLNGVGMTEASEMMIGGGAANDCIIDVTTSSFMTDVIEASRSQPVIVDFWAPWCGPCKQLMPVLEKVVTETGGKVRLAKVNIDENQAIAAQLRIQSVPTVYAFVDGQPVDGFAGGQPESAVREFVNKLAEAAGGAAEALEMLLQQGEQSLAAGAIDQAMAAFQQALMTDNDSALAVGGLIRCLVASNALDEAREMIDALTETMQQETAVADAIQALALAEKSAESVAQLGSLEDKLAANPDDLDIMQQLAMAYYGAGRGAEAISLLLNSIALDRSWNDEAARLQLLEIFAALGPTHPEVLAGRRKLSALLFS